MKNEIAIFVLLISLCSCKAVDIDSLVPSDSLPQANALPPVEIVLDPSVEMSFPTTSRYTGRQASTSTVYTPQFGFNSKNHLKVTGINATQVHVPAVAAGTANHPQMYELARRTFDRHVRSMIDLNLPKSNAKIHCKVIDTDFERNFIWSVPTLLTLGVSTMFGVPCSYYDADVELELEIIDPRKGSLAVYSASGKGEAYSACYWGYSQLPNPSPSQYPGLPNEESHVPTVRAALVLAMSDALKKITSQVQDDSETLREKLGV